MADNKENRELQEKINSLREKEISLTQQLVSLREKLSLISEKDAKNLERISSIQQEILDLENQSDKVSRQIVDTQGKVLSAQKEIVDSKEEEADLSDDISLSEKLRFELIGKQLKIYDSIDDTYDSTVDLSERLLKNSNLTKDSAERISSIAELTKQEQQSFNNLLMSDKGHRDQILDVMKASANVGYELSNIEEQISSSSLSASKGKLEIIDLTAAQNVLEKIQSEIKSKENVLTKDAIDALVQKASLLESSIDLAKKQNEISKETANTYNAIGQGMENVFSGVESAISKVPGGKALMQMFGFDEMKDKIENQMGGALNNVVGSFKSGGLVSGMKSLPGAAMQFGKALLVGPQVAIFGIVAAVGALISLFMDLDGAASEVQKELGGTKKEALATHEAAHEMAHEMNLVGVNTKEVVKGIKTVSDLMGGVDLKGKLSDPGVKTMVEDATLLTEKFGMSQDEMEKVHSLSIMTGKSMATLAGEAIKVAGGAMSAKNAVKLLGTISPQVAVAFKGSTKELIAAAAKAKMLGMELNKVQDIGMGMLDIESSLEKEMEARVLTGKNLNLDAARQYALQGDIVGLQEELLNQAGSLEDFREMGPIQQKAMADAMGMSVEEMTNMLTKAQEMEDLGLDRQLQEDLANATAEEKSKIYNDQAAKLEAMGKTDEANLARQKAAQEESASAAEKFGDIMTKIKETAMKLVAPILDVVHGLMDGVLQGGGLMAAFDGVIAVLKPIMDIVMGIGKVLFAVLIHPTKMLFSILTPIFDVFKEIFSAFSSGQEGASGISETFDKIASVISEVSSAIGEVVSIFISGLLEPSKILWKAILTPIWETFKGIYDTLSKAFEPLFAANDAGEDTVGIMDTIKKVMGAIAPVLELIGGLIAGVIMRPFQMIASLIQFVIKLFTGDMTGAVDILGQYLFDYFLGLPEMVITAVTGIIDSLFGTNLTEGVTEFFGFLKDGFKAVAGLIEPIFGFIQKIGGLVLDYILQPFKSIWGVIEGIGKLFTGDLTGGLEQIGTAIGDFFMSPVNLVMGLFDAFVGLFTGIADKIKGIVKDLLPGWALDLLGLGEEEESSAKSTKSTGSAATVEVPKMASGGSVEKAGLAIVGEQGPEVVSLPAGATVASTGASDQTGSIIEALGLSGMISSEPKSESESGGFISGLSEGIGGILGGVVGGITNIATSGGSDMSKVEQKLDTLIGLFTQAANQPTVIKFGDKTVEEIKTQLNFKKSYNVGVDNTYGRTI